MGHRECWGIARPSQQKLHKEGVRILPHGQIPLHRPVLILDFGSGTATTIEWERFCFDWALGERVSEIPGQCLGWVQMKRKINMRGHYVETVFVCNLE